MGKKSLLSVLILALGICVGSVYISADSLQAQDEAPKGTFLSWTDEKGGRHFTDDRKTIPQAYQASAKEITWETLETNTNLKRTVSQTPAPVKRTVKADPGQPEQIYCGLPYTRDLVWVERGGITRRMVHTFDSCGALIDEDFAGDGHR